MKVLLYVTITKSSLYPHTFKGLIYQVQLRSIQNDAVIIVLLTQVIPASLQELSFVSGPLGHLRGQLSVSVLNLDDCRCCLPCDHGSKWILPMAIGYVLRSTLVVGDIFACPAIPEKNGLRDIIKSLFLLGLIV